MFLRWCKSPAWSRDWSSGTGTRSIHPGRRRCSYQQPHLSCTPHRCNISCRGRCTESRSRKCRPGIRCRTCTKTSRFQHAGRCPRAGTDSGGTGLCCRSLCRNIRPYSGSGTSALVATAAVAASGRSTERGIDRWHRCGTVGRNKDRGFRTCDQTFQTGIRTGSRQLERWRNFRLAGMVDCGTRRSSDSMDRNRSSYKRIRTFRPTVPCTCRCSGTDCARTDRRTGNWCRSRMANKCTCTCYHCSTCPGDTCLDRMGLYSSCSWTGTNRRNSEAGRRTCNRTSRCSDRRHRCGSWNWNRRLSPRSVPRSANCCTHNGRQSPIRWHTCRSWRMDCSGTGWSTRIRRPRNHPDSRTGSCSSRMRAWPRTCLHSSRASWSRNWTRNTYRQTNLKQTHPHVVHMLSTCCPNVVHMLSTCCPNECPSCMIRLEPILARLHAEPVLVK